MTSTFKPAFIVNDPETSPSVPPQDVMSWYAYGGIIIGVVLIAALLIYLTYIFFFSGNETATIASTETAKYDPIQEAKKIVSQLPNYITSPQFSDPLEMA
jgi:hypothetical protein